MKKSLLTASCVVIACLLVASPVVQATTMHFGFVKNDKFVWKWLYEHLNSGGSINSTATYYRMLNITNLVNGSNSVDLGLQYYTANQSDYEANGVAGSHWGTSLLFPTTIHNGNTTEAFNGFFNVVGTSLVPLSSMSTTNRSNAIMRMNMMPVPEFFAYMFALTFATGNSSNRYSNTTAVISPSTNSASTYVFATLDTRAGSHWNNLSIEVISLFKYDASRAILTTFNANVSFETIQWWSNISAYHDSSGLSHHEYSIVYPTSLVPSTTTTIDGYTVVLSVAAVSTGTAIIVLGKHLQNKKNL